MLLLVAAGEDLVWAAEHGADDVLAVPFEPSLLRLKLSLAQRIARERNEAQHFARRAGETEQEARRLHALAYTDTLTGLPNRRYLDDWMAELAPGRVGIDSFAIHMIDLDGFKAINDRFGHRDGDQLLQQVAERLCRGCRRFDIVVRLGGDELAAVQVGAGSEADARAFAQRLLANMREPFRVGSAEVQISASIGCALYPAHGALPSDLLHRADLAMYAAKSAGRQAPHSRRGDAAELSRPGSFMMFSTDPGPPPATPPARHARFPMAGTLFSPAFALLSGQFVGAWTQWPPPAPPGSGTASSSAAQDWQGPALPPRGSGAEAARSGLPPPGAAAGINGMATGPDAAFQALGIAFREAAAWRDGAERTALRPRPVFGATIHAGLLADVGALEVVRRLLRLSGADPLDCELVLQAPEVLVELEALHRLRELGLGIGVRVGLEGIVLQRLLRLPLTRLHLEPELLAADASEDSILLRTTVLFARSLRAPLLAHGVETRDQLDRLRRLEVDSATGTYLSGPLDGMALESLRRRIGPEAGNR
ncbi:diguanylate cyclase [Acetobacteraceae bacterium KSS12]|uniref:Diguanylate cyclase n=1 Tax=Rhizosaccharibacter radicis TaxID=2782605 RepID=A0ABT1VZV3_9PROT|nr:diguanylate cyclase [Acetobacteraceae bacterium KSS12]